MCAIADPGLYFQRLVEVLHRRTVVRTVGQASRECADLVDDLGVVEPERNVRVGVLRLERDRAVERLPDLAADACRQRLHPRTRSARSGRGRRPACTRHWRRPATRASPHPRARPPRAAAGSPPCHRPPGRSRRPQPTCWRPWLRTPSASILRRSPSKNRRGGRHARPICSFASAGNGSRSPAVKAFPGLLQRIACVVVVGLLVRERRGIFTAAIVDSCRERGILRQRVRRAAATGRGSWRRRKRASSEAAVPARARKRTAVTRGAAGQSGRRASASAPRRTGRHQSSTTRSGSAARSRAAGTDAATTSPFLRRPADAQQPPSTAVEQRRGTGAGDALDTTSRTFFQLLWRPPSPRPPSPGQEFESTTT